MKYLGENNPVKKKPLRIRGVRYFHELSDEISGKYLFHGSRHYDSEFSGCLISETADSKIYKVEWQTGKNSGHGTITIYKDGRLIFDQRVSGAGIYRYVLN